jgi:hypothetical protein
MCCNHDNLKKFFSFFWLWWLSGFRFTNYGDILNWDFVWILILEIRWFSAEPWQSFMRLPSPKELDHHTGSPRCTHSGCTFRLIQNFHKSIVNVSFDNMYIFPSHKSNACGLDFYIGISFISLISFFKIDFS